MTTYHRVKGEDAWTGGLVLLSLTPMTLVCRSRRALVVAGRRAFVHLKVLRAGSMESSTSHQVDVLFFDVPIYPLLAPVSTQWIIKTDVAITLPRIRM